MYGNLYLRSRRDIDICMYTTTVIAHRYHLIAQCANQANGGTCFRLEPSPICEATDRLITIAFHFCIEVGARVASWPWRMHTETSLLASEIEFGSGYPSHASSIA